MAEETPKKDLTSLIELSALELAKNPQGSEHGDGALAAQEIEKVTDADFGTLDEMAKAAALAPEPQFLEQPPNEAPQMEAPAFEAAPPVEQPALEPLNAGLSDPIGTNGAPNSLDAPNALDAPNPPDSPLDSPVSVGASESSSLAMAPLEEPHGMVSDPPSIRVNEDPPFQPQAIPPSGEALGGLVDPTISVVTSAPKSSLKSSIDPERPAVNAPPAGAQHAIKASAPPTGAQDLSPVKKFGEKLAIGKPRIEGAPAFSVLVSNNSGHFDEKTIKAIEDAITSEDFGVRLEEISVQLSAGKLLVPQISEFAAITLAQKLRDVVDNIELDLATEIYKSSVTELTGPDDSILVDTEEYESHREEVADIGAAPRSENDLFSTNLSELSEYQVTRVLSVVISSNIILAEVAENPAGREFEIATENLTRELISRAFKLGAHGILGVNFTLKSIDAHRDAAGKIRRAYRLLGTGTAVRVRKKQD